MTEPTAGMGSPVQSPPALDEVRVSQALARVGDLWPDGLGAVPGTYEVALKQDADTIRALANFWRRANAPKRKRGTRWAVKRRV